MISYKYILKNRPLKDGRRKIAMRILKDKRKKVVTLRIKCLSEDFHDQRLKSSFRGYKRKNKYLRDLKDIADTIVDEFELKGINFTIEDFIKKLFNNEEEEISLHEAFNRKISSDHIKPKTAKAYRDTINSFKRYYPHDLMINQVTPEIIEGYISHLKLRGSNDGGIKFFLRHLKVIVKLCIKLNNKSEEINPFKDVNLSRFNRRTKKRALSLSEMKAFIDVNLEDRPDLAESHRLALFSFYCRGINFVDLIDLKWSDFSNDMITYHRSKTGKMYVFNLLKPALNILNYYRKLRKTQFVFPIKKSDGLTPIQFENLRHRSLRKYNSNLKEIANIAKIQTNLSSYTIRHTYATLLKVKGVSTDIISESMGHSDLKVTQNYLKEFGDDVLDKEHEKLLDL